MSTLTKLSIFFLITTSLGQFACTAAVDYPGTPPAVSEGVVDAHQMQLSNDVIRCCWTFSDGQVESLAITNRQVDETLSLRSGHMPRIVLSDGSTIDLANLRPLDGYRCETIQPNNPRSPRGEDAFGGHQLLACFKDDKSGLTLNWSAQLRDGSNYVNQTLTLKADRDVKIERIVFLDAPIANARQIGTVGGSVIVCGDIFLAFESPLAENVISESSVVRCSQQRSVTLRGGQAEWKFSSVAGVVPEGQLRRGFLYYLERRRAHPYRPFLHYNSWFHLNLGRPLCRMEEKECLDAIEYIGRELVQQRGVQLDAFVWDDGWDDPNTLWQFHDGFPRGFSETLKASKKYGATTGVWISPWGGYEPRLAARVEYGKTIGLEIEGDRFSLSDPKYYEVFRNSCLDMIRRYETSFFKFDGMGGSNTTTGESGKDAENIDAVLRLVGELREEKPDIFISATSGTWASPFWALFADCTWRQGYDVNFHGEGDHRQQWITYRDMVAYERVVCRGPLYPLNSLMNIGLCVGERDEPAKMPRDEKSVIDETWMMFGCGANIRELYISPHLLTPKMWDELAKAAKWSRANSEVLVDTHWIGGDPGKGQIYGFAAWSPDKATLVLRNPASKPQSFEFSPRRDWEIPKGINTLFTLNVVHGKSKVAIPKTLSADNLHKIELEPFGIVIIEGLSSDN